MRKFASIGDEINLRRLGNRFSKLFVFVQFGCFRFAFHRFLCLFDLLFCKVAKRRVQLVTVGNQKVGKSTLLQHGWLNDPFDASFSTTLQDDVDLDRTTSVLLFDRLDEKNNLHWHIRDLPGQPEFWATNTHFLLAHCMFVFLFLRNIHDSTPTPNRHHLLSTFGWLSSLAT